MSLGDVYLQLLTNYTLLRPGDYLALVKLQTEMLPRYMPQKWGNTESTTYIFNPRNLKKLVPKSGKMDSLLWQGNNINELFGSWHIAREHESIINPGFIKFSVAITKFDQKTMTDFLKACNSITNVRIGFIDATTEKYNPIGDENGFIEYGGMRLNAFILRHYLPEMPWATVFGRDYIDLFGLDTVLSAPAYRVELLDENAIYIQLTKDLKDFINHFDTAMSVRENVKKHLGYDCFYQKEKLYKWHLNENNKSGTPYRVPKTFKILDIEEMPPQSTSPYFKKLDPADIKVSLMDKIRALIPCETAVFKTNNDADHVMRTYFKHIRKDGGEYTPILVVPNEMIFSLLKDGIKGGGPFEYLARAEKLDFAETVTRRVDETGFSAAELHDLEGEFIESPSSPIFSSIYRDLAAQEIYPELILAKIPTKDAWQAPAWMPLGMNVAGRPSIEEQIVFFRVWFDRFSARPAVCGSESWDVWVDVPVNSPDGALEVARQQFAFASDIVLQGSDSIGHLAGIIYKSPIWHFWWD